MHAKRRNTTAPARDSRAGAVVELFAVAELELEPENNREIVRLVVREASRGLLVIDIDVARFDEERRPTEAEVEASATVVADVGLGVLNCLGAIRAVRGGRIASDPVCARAADEIEAARRAKDR